MRRAWYPLSLLAVFSVLWVAMAINPTYRFDWFLENLLVFISIPVLVFTYNRIPLSKTSYTLLFVFISMHVIGSHWTYSNVPIDWAAMGFKRNMYDRVVHGCFGLLLSLPMVEALQRFGVTRRPVAWLLAIQSVLAFSAIYEIVEMVTALIVAPEAGDAFLGTQGDTFDSVQDMAIAGVGSLVAAAGALAAWAVARGRRRGTAQASAVSQDTV